VIPAPGATDEFDSPSNPLHPMDAADEGAWSASNLPPYAIFSLPSIHIFGGRIQKARSRRVLHHPRQP